MLVDAILGHHIPCDVASSRFCFTLYDGAGCWLLPCAAGRLGMCLSAVFVHMGIPSHGEQPARETDRPLGMRLQCVWGTAILESALQLRRTLAAQPLHPPP